MFVLVLALVSMFSVNVTDHGRVRLRVKVNVRVRGALVSHSVSVTYMC